MSPETRKSPGWINYRLQRLLLAKSFSYFLRIFVPVAGIAGIGYGVIAWTGIDFRLKDALSQIQESVTDNPDFMISGATFQGASPHTENEIRALLPTRFPVSPFDINVNELKRDVEKLPAAISASVSLNPSGYIEIVVVERAPALIWRNEFDLLLLDSDGRVIGSALRRLDHPELTLVAGPGSDTAAPEAMQIVSAAKPIAEMIRGLVRVGERRWDVVLDRSRTIMLPEKNPVVALSKIIKRNDADGILSRSISVVDLRNPERMTVRLAENGNERAAMVGS